MTVTSERPRGLNAYVAFGANLGDRADTILDAAAALAETDGVELVAIAPALESVAVKLEGLDPDAPRYLNTVAIVSTELSPADLHAVLRHLEDVHGRVRGERWGDRTLDLDLITYGDLTQDDPELTIPHPRAHERDFVLGPWREIDPDATLPGRGRVADLLARLSDAERTAAADAEGNTP